MDSLGALSVFVRAAEALSFTEAGRQLGLSSSAIGKAVARLEDRLGVRLFHRSTRSVALTEEGRMFLESCRRIISEVETVEQEFAQARAAPKGKLRVSLPLLGMLFGPVLSKFMLEHPQIELDLDFDDRLVDVINDGYDVAIRTGEGNDSRLMSRPLGTYELKVVAAPAYLARAGVPRIPQDLAGHVCIHHKYPTTGKFERWPFRATGDGEVFVPATAAASTLEPLIALAEFGVGLTCVPDFTIRRQIADGSLVQVLDDHLQHSNIFRAVWPSSRHLSPRIRVFVDFLAENLFAGPS